MGWEKRRGRSYYYRKRRDGDRVRSVYLGAGDDVQLYAEVVAAAREDKARAAPSASRARRPEPDAPLVQAVEIAETLAKAALLAYGFHTHKREWRRMRHE